MSLETCSKLPTTDVRGAKVTLIYHCLMLCDNADEQLFDNVGRNFHHTLHNLLPPESLASQNYSLRSRAHNRQLPEHFNHLDDSNFIIHMLYKNMY